MIFISACLAGKPCRYDGQSKKRSEIDALLEQPHRLICPECAGKLPIPRLPAEIQGGDGEAVLQGKAKVIDQNGKDVTPQFLAGARHILKIAQECGVEAVYLKSKSPSCGIGRIYDGTFSGKLIPGDGVLAALLKREGIAVFSIE